MMASWSPRIASAALQLAAEDPDCLESLETLTLVFPLSIPMTVEMALEFKTAQVDLMTACIMKKLEEPASRALEKSAFEELVAQLDVEFRKPDKPLLKFVQRSVKGLDLDSGAPEVEALTSEIAALKELITFSTKEIKAMMKKLTDVHRSGAAAPAGWLWG